MVFAYTFFGYNSSELLDPHQQYTLGTISLYIVGLVYCVNFFVMLFATGGKIRWAIRKIKILLAKKKVKKALKEQKRLILINQRRELIDLSDEEE